MNKDLSIYLIVQYVGKPRNPRMTSQPGYISNPENMIYEETIMVSRGLNPRDRQNGHVVLNLTEETLIKNTFSDEKDFTKLLAHYVDGFGDQINNTIKALNETTQTK